MKPLIIILLTFNFVPFLSHAQMQGKPTDDLEIFKTKLNKYFKKYNKYYDTLMVKEFPDTTTYNMPTGNYNSLMIDEEIGLAFEFSTKKIYDKETGLVFYIKKNQIYDPQKEKYYNYLPN